MSTPVVFCFDQTQPLSTDMTYRYVQEQHVMYNGLNGLQDPGETGLNQASQKIHI